MIKELNHVGCVTTWSVRSGSTDLFGMDVIIDVPFEGERLRGDLGVKDVKGRSSRFTPPRRIYCSSYSNSEAALPATSSASAGVS